MMKLGALVCAAIALDTPRPPSHAQLLEALMKAYKAGMSDPSMLKDRAKQLFDAGYIQALDDVDRIRAELPIISIHVFGLEPLPRKL